MTMDAIATDAATFTRIHIRTDLGQYEFWADSWEPEVQDDDRTLYLRGRGSGTYAKTQREISLSAPRAERAEDPE